MRKQHADLQVADLAPTDPLSMLGFKPLGATARTSLVAAACLIAFSSVQAQSTQAGAQTDADVATPVGSVREVTVEPADQAPQPVEVNYIVAPGDTLIGISDKLLKPDLDWRYLRAVNGLNDVTQLVPGQRLRIPANWIRNDPVEIGVNSFSGDVSINGQPVTPNMRVVESDLIETGEDSTVLVTLPDGTQMQIAPSSQVRIDRLRKYFGNDAVDARVRLEKGGVDTRVAPKQDFEPNRPGTVVPDIRTAPSGSLNPARRFIIQTPKATAAVRGTEFRVTDDDAKSSSAVLKGEVNWSAGQAQVGLDRGFGSTADEAGTVTEPEQLLPAPKLIAPTEDVSDLVTKLDFDAIEGAVQYRVRTATDPAFTAGLAEQVVSVPAAIISSEQDGPYYLAVRGISQTGVEGYDGNARLVFDARPLAPNLSGPSQNSTQFSTRTGLSWLQPKNVDSYQLQIATDPDFENLVIDEPLDGATYQYVAPDSEPAPRKRWWRVASIDSTGRGPFSPVQNFTQRDPGPAPKAEVSALGTQIRWPAIPDATGYGVVVTPLNESASPAREVAVTEPSVLLTGLEPGRYQIQVITEFDGGLRSPPGEAQSFTIKLLLRDASGNPVSSGGGQIEGIQPD